VPVEQAQTGFLRLFTWYGNARHPSDDRWPAGNFSTRRPWAKASAFPRLCAFVRQPTDEVVCFFHRFSVFPEFASRIEVGFDVFKRTLPPNGVGCA